MLNKSNRKNKYVLCLFIFTFFLIGFQSNIKAEEGIVLTKEDAMTMFENQSYEIKKINYQNELFLISYEDLEEDVEDQYNDMIDSKDELSDTSKSDSDYDEVELNYINDVTKYVSTQKTFENNTYEKENKDETTSKQIDEKFLEFEKQLYDYEISKQQLYVQEKKLKMLESELNEIERKYDKGLVSYNDYLIQKYNYDKEALSYESSSNELEMLNNKLKIKLMYDAEDEVEFNIELPEKVFDDSISGVYILSLYQENNYEYLNKIKEIEIEDEALSIVNQYLDKNSDDYKTYYINYQIDQIENNEWLDENNNRILSDYYNLLQLKADYETKNIEYTKQRNVLIEKENLYENNLISINELNENIINSELASLDIKKIIVDINYNLNKLLLEIN